MSEICHVRFLRFCTMVQEALYTLPSSVQSQMADNDLGTLTVAEADESPDVAKRRARQLYAVEQRLRSIERQLELLSDFWEFGATTDLDYRMAEAEMAGLRQERTKLQEIKGDL